MSTRWFEDGILYDGYDEISCCRCESFDSDCKGCYYVNNSFKECKTRHKHSRNKKSLFRQIRFNAR